MTSKPVLIDGYCGAGGATKGYQRAGFYVIGVDVKAQPNYCGDEFVQADFLTFPLEGAQAVHASPPCQRWVGWQRIGALRGATNDHPDLVTPTRERLQALSVPWVIENIPDAPLKGITLCGSQFGLGVSRHRVFETSFLILQPTGHKCRHSKGNLGVYGKLDGRRLFTRSDGSELRNPSSLNEAQAAMGIDWMEWDELKESIPPAYTEWIGARLFKVVRQGVR